MVRLRFGPEARPVEIARWCAERGVVLPSPTRSPRLARACVLLLGQLWSAPRPAEHLVGLARQEGISLRTLKSAKGTLGVETKRRGWGRGSVVWWRLNRAPIGCRIRDVEEANRPFFDRLGKRLWGPDTRESVGIPAGPGGSFVWVGPKGVRTYAERVRREATARGERPLPPLTRREVEGEYPDWVKEWRRSGRVSGEASGHDALFPDDRPGAS